MPQPRPGPSPTPTPVPTHAIMIGEILPHQLGGGATIIPESEWIPPFNVDADYMALEPEAGGYFYESDDVVSYLSPLQFGARWSTN